MRPVGLLSTGTAQTGRRIHGQPILGGLEQAGAVLDRLAADGREPAALVLTEPDLAGERLARLVAVAEARSIPVRRAPRPTALRPTATLELAPVAIEDLLNREQVPLDRDGMARLVRGRRVLVTGAGGTIGGELSRQVAALGPGHLTLLDSGEYALWQIDLELGETFPSVPRAAVLADIRDGARVRAVVAECRPELVFHAAALKHVPMVEAHPLEGLLTNAVGTRHVADAAGAAGATAMVLISTDKSVNPSSVMGASKRLAEMYCQALDIQALEARARGAVTGAAPGTQGVTPGTMRCITVRFGNVLGSNGSVVPLFRRQLERGGPLTVTHPEMRRYFMTVREAVGLVLEASVVGTAGPVGPAPAEPVGPAPAEPIGSARGAGPREARPGAMPEGGIFVLDMGEPVRIVDLARQMIRLAGLQPERDVAIRYTGLRPGEKLDEELFHGEEAPRPTGHPGLLVAVPRTADLSAVAGALDQIEALCRADRPDAALALLGRMVPEFAHNPGGEARGASAAIPEAAVAEAAVAAASRRGA